MYEYGDEIVPRHQKALTLESNIMMIALNFDGELFHQQFVF